MKKFAITKFDIVLFVLLIAITLSATVFIAGEKAEEGDRVIIKVNGELYGKYPLSENRELEIQTEYGYNKVNIENSKVWVSDSDCENRVCMDFGKAKSPGVVIVCLPHRLSITIESDSGFVPDAVIY